MRTSGSGFAFFETPSCNVGATAGARSRAIPVDKIFDYPWQYRDLAIASRPAPRRRISVRPDPDKGLQFLDPQPAGTQRVGGFFLLQPSPPPLSNPCPSPQEFRSSTFTLRKRQRIQSWMRAPPAYLPLRVLGQDSLRLVGPKCRLGVCGASHPLGVPWTLGLQSPGGVCCKCGSHSSLLSFPFHAPLPPLFLCVHLVSVVDPPARRGSCL